ncbi:hypothetical protein KAR91_05270 [Candidatus Pacearchaeota archaeon]|nr:hypothetical protein [Candidatus Pacearchaeota archaeon]
MPNYRITLKDVGRNKVNSGVLTTQPNLKAAEDRALKECKQYLASRSVDLDQTGSHTYMVTAGCRNVGFVTIEQTSC